MVLTEAQIKAKNIVDRAVGIGWRATTYDATVGCIIQEGQEIAGSSFKLPPRGIVWVVSAETFEMPSDVTGLATLKTQWTHQGVLALNVGVIDPGWNGPLSATLVNLGNSPFTIRQGEPFFRILFHDHAIATVSPTIKSMDEYKNDTLLRSRLFSPTFLNMQNLTNEVADEVLRIPRWGFILTLVATVIAVLAIFLPIAISVWTDYYLGPPAWN